MHFTEHTFGNLLIRPSFFPERGAALIEEEKSDEFAEQSS